MVQKAIDLILSFSGENSVAENALQIATTRHVVQSYSGPLPPPDVLREYEETMSGMSDRIVTRWETEQKHRHEMDQLILNREFNLKLIGNILGIIALTLMLLVVSYLAFLGHPAEAVGLGVGTIVSVVAIFVLARRYDIEAEKARASEEE